jgi:predicted nucleic-acid-binding Zn-ribbon protein
MKLFRSICESCGEHSYVFPDQVELIKQRPNLKLHKFAKEKLSNGSDWFCIKCDASKKDGSRCKLVELTGDKAKNLLKIRQRETNLKSDGFILPKLY